MAGSAQSHPYAVVALVACVHVAALATPCIADDCTPDIAAPVATAYSATASASASGIACSAAVPDLSAGLVATDNCTASGQIAISQIPAAGSSIGIGVHACTLRLADLAGNIQDYTVQLTVSGSPVAYYADADADGFGRSTDAAQNACAPVAGKVADNTDCNDSDAAIHPGAAERCNGADDDCDLAIDETPATFRYYRDDDGDGFGDASVSLANCTGVAPDGFVGNSADCDDAAVLYADADGDGRGAGPFAGCGVATSNDNCPSTANPDQANCDGDAQGNACDANDDNDAAIDANDAFPCDATKSVGDASLSPAELAAFLAGASGVDVHAGGMSPDQLAAVANNAIGIGAQGIKGAFTVPASLSAAQITAILDRAAPGGLSTITVDAAGMQPAQLAAVAADIAAVAVVSNLSVASTSSAADIAALVSKASVASAIATGMDATRLTACVSGAGVVTFTGMVLVDAGVSAVDIAEIAASLGSSGSTDLRFDSAGMSGGQISAANAALAALATANGGVNPYCGTVDTDSDGSFADACFVHAVDCGDSSGAIHPGAVETCANDGIDNDCDGDASSDAEATDASDFYADNDLDGFGAGALVKSCTAVAGRVGTSTDCNDSNPAIHPGAAEVCATLAVDNDCDGVTDESEAADRATWYADTDSDGAGDPASTQLACMQPAGFIAVPGDGCPSTGALTAPITYYADADADGAGNPAAPQAFCATSAPAGYASNASDGCPADSNKTAPGTCGCGVADIDSDSDGVLNCNDGCPNDANKTAPGTCGCGVADTDSDGDGTANCNDGCPNDAAKTTAGACGCGFADTDFNGNTVADCLETSPVLSFTASDNTLRAGDALVVRVSASTPTVELGGVQLAMHFDPTRFAIVSVVPVAGGPFQTELAEIVDNTLGTLQYNVGVSPSSVGGMTVASNLFDINLAVLSADTVCASSVLLSVADVGAATTRFLDMSANAVSAIPAAMPSLRVDSQGPVLSGVMTNATAATDAGSTYGGFVAQPTVTASDDCDGARTVTVSVTNPDTTVTSGWPAGGLFAIGQSTVTWTATDTIGNSASASRTVTIANHQLLDITVSLQGPLATPSARAITLKVGAQTTVVSVGLSGSSGSLSGIQVPVAAGYACLSARDAAHSVSDTASATVSSRRYSASLLLLQGDSSNDDLVDIFDYAIFLADRSTAASPLRAVDARSNFNGDTFVSGTDFAYISLNFMRVGEVCGAFTGGVPRDRVSVKDLRRAGLGDLAAADLNHDGWVDTRDMQAYVQGGGTPQLAPAPDRPRW